MGGAVFTPKQQNWQWFSDAHAEPVEPDDQLAAEGVKPTLPNNNQIRLRVCIAETGGKAENNAVVTIEYSTNDSDFYAFGPSQHWDYADGLATEGDTITGLLLDDSDTQGEYCESSSATVSWGASEAVEIDICIDPTGSVSASTTYYFRIKLDGTEVPLNTGESHPQVLTAEPGSIYNEETTLTGDADIGTAGSLTVEGASTLTADSGISVAYNLDIYCAAILTADAGDLEEAIQEMFDSMELASDADIAQAGGLSFNNATSESGDADVVTVGNLVIEVSVEF